MMETYQILNMLKRPNVLKNKFKWINVLSLQQKALESSQHITDTKLFKVIYLKKKTSNYSSGLHN